MPTERCWGCNQIKRNVKLCGDDRYCPECDDKNEKALAVIRAEKEQAERAGTSTATPGNKVVCIPAAPKSKVEAAKKQYAAPHHKSPAGNYSAAVARATPSNSGVVQNTSKLPANDAAVAAAKSCGKCPELQNKVFSLKAQVEKQTQMIQSLTEKLNLVLSVLGIPDLNNQSTPAEVETQSRSAEAASDDTAAPKAILEQLGEPQSDMSNRYRNNLIAAVYADQQEDARRQSTFIVKGLAPSEDKSDTSLVSELCQTELNIQPNIVHCKRLGKAESDGKLRPLLVCLDSIEISQQIIRSAKSLRKSNDERTKNNVYINANLTRARAKAEFEQRQRRRRTKNAAGENEQRVHSVPTTDTHTDAGSAEPEPAQNVVNDTPSPSSSSSASVPAMPQGQQIQHSHAIPRPVALARVTRSSSRATSSE